MKSPTSTPPSPDKPGVSKPPARSPPTPEEQEDILVRKLIEGIRQGGEDRRARERLAQLRAAILFGQQMALTEAAQMLVAKTRQALSTLTPSPQQPAPPPPPTKTPPAS